MKNIMKIFLLIFMGTYLSAEVYNESFKSQILPANEIDNVYFTYQCNQNRECTKVSTQEINNLKKQLTSNSTSLLVGEGYAIPVLPDMKTNHLYFKAKKRMNFYKKTGKIKATNINNKNYPVFPYLFVMEMVQMTPVLQSAYNDIEKYYSTENSKVAWKLAQPDLLKRFGVSESQMPNAMKITSGYETLFLDLIDSNDYDRLFMLALFVAGPPTKQDLQTKYRNDILKQEPDIRTVNGMLIMIGRDKNILNSLVVALNHYTKANNLTDRISGNQSKEQKAFFNALLNNDTHEAKKILSNNFDFALSGIYKGLLKL